MDTSKNPMYTLGMEWLNFRHLLYFWTVVKEGGVAKGGKALHLSQPTISGQLRLLERSLGSKLFDKSGRKLVLSETGKVVFRYADELFTLGKEMLDVLQGRPTGRERRLVVGVTDALPKLIVHRLLEPALRLNEPIRLICVDGPPDQLLAQLALHNLDLVLSDVPATPAAASVRAFNHLLGQCGVSLFGTVELAAKLRRGFPHSLDGAPILLPADKTTLRASLEKWFEAKEIRPNVRGEFADGALMNVFGQSGAGAFAAHDIVEQQVRKQYGVRLIGRIEPCRERFFAITVERRLKHPGVLAVTEAAREEIFT